MFLESFSLSGIEFCLLGNPNSVVAFLLFKGALLLYSVAVFWKYCCSDMLFIVCFSL